jgi:hypothetical protein
MAARHGRKSTGKVEADVHAEAHDEVMRCFQLSVTLDQNVPLARLQLRASSGSVEKRELEIARHEKISEMQQTISYRLELLWPNLLDARLALGSFDDENRVLDHVEDIQGYREVSWGLETEAFSHFIRYSSLRSPVMQNS